MQRSKYHRDGSNNRHLQALVYTELVLHTESSVESGVCIFKFADLSAIYEARIKGIGISKITDKSRFKEQILDTFVEDCQE